MVSSDEGLGVEDATSGAESDSGSEMVGEDLDETFRMNSMLDPNFQPQPEVEQEEEQEYTAEEKAELDKPYTVDDYMKIQLDTSRTQEEIEDYLDEMIMFDQSMGYDQDAQSLQAIAQNLKNQAALEAGEGGRTL